MFESRLKGQEYDISFDSVRWLFVVPDFAWNAKKTNPNKKFLPIFNGRNSKGTICGRWNAVLDDGHIIFVKWRTGTSRNFKNINPFLVICSSFSFVRQF